MESRTIVEAVKGCGSKRISYVWAVRKSVSERVHPDGTTYTMNYGIETVLEKVSFDSLKLSTSKEVIEAIAQLTKKYRE